MCGMAGVQHVFCRNFQIPILAAQIVTFCISRQVHIFCVRHGWKRQTSTYHREMYSHPVGSPMMAEPTLKVLIASIDIPMHTHKHP